MSDTGVAGTAARARLQKWKKPFDVFVEGLLVSSSRGDKTPVELFIISAAELGDHLPRPSDDTSKRY
jgi:hypothetical protein